MLKYLIIASTFLAVTLGVLLLRSGNEPSLYNNAVFVSAPQVIDPPTQITPQVQPARVAARAIAPVTTVIRPPHRDSAGTRVAIAAPNSSAQAITSQDDLLRTITSGAFAGMEKVTPTAPLSGDGKPAQPDALQAMIIQSLRDGRTAPQTQVRPATPRTPSPLQVLETTTYVVKPGDSLGTIATRFYGRKEDYYRIYEANKSRLSSPDSIRVGQKLLVPKS